MSKRTPVLPKVVLVMATMLYMLSCKKEAALKADFMARLSDSIPVDTIPCDSTDTIPDTSFIPRLLPVNALTLLTSTDSTGIDLFFNTVDRYPYMFISMDLYFNYSRHSIDIYTPGVTAIKYDSTKNAYTQSHHHMPWFADSTAALIIPITFSGVRGSNTVYEGSLTVTDSLYIFNWSHDSVMNIEQKIIPRI